ncbi:glucosaminidase domain-containing protein [Bacteroides ovatus]|uniref:glucosaminidase domain-containing protein n=1 Tax=Bacteroides ovatus TaxID=28116 RepID=UPI00189FA987|nr:glucosaminidase domain-containing protein [Bacteroides ovatus]
MRKKFIKSSRPTYKKRIKKAQQGMRFVSYNPVSNPTIDYTDITNPINPFSEYNYNTTYDKPEALVVPVRDTNETDVVANNPTVEPVINKSVASKPVTDKPVTANSTWKSPYTNRKQWSTELINAYKKAGITNDNAIRMLLAQDALESSWGKSAQGKYNFGNLTTGSSWKGDYVTGNDKNAKGEAIKQKFRSYNSMDEYAADKIQFLKRLYDFDENDDINKFVAKLTGSNKGKRRYAEATNYAKVLTGVYNGIPKGENGMIIKYQNPPHGIARRDAIKDYRPEIPFSPIKQPVKPYMPTQQPILSPDNRTGWEKEVSRQIKADRAKNDNLYGNQHTWNWFAPFTNARITKDNASAMFDFDKSAAMSTFAIGQGIASPVTTATSIAGSLVGAGIGNKVAGEKGALVGGFVGGMVNPKFGMRFNKKNGFRGDAASARNATTTPRFNISKESLPDYAKPNWQGDELALTKERLANGGFDRLEQFSKYSGEKAEQFRNATGMGYRDFYPFENDFGKTYRQYLLDSKPAKGTRADFKVNKEVAAFSDRTQNVYTTILDDVPDRFKNPQYRTTTEAHEFAHFAFNPQRRPPLDVYNPPLTNPHREYLLGLKDRNEYGTELTARGTQIKNYFGLDKDKPITEDMLKYAADNYVKDKGFDNNMTDFFSGIKNYKEMAKWLSELSPMLALPLLNY